MFTFAWHTSFNALYFSSKYDDVPKRHFTRNDVLGREVHPALNVFEYLSIPPSDEEITNFAYKYFLTNTFRSYYLKVSDMQVKKELVEELGEFYAKEKSMTSGCFEILRLYGKDLDTRSFYLLAAKMATFQNIVLNENRETPITSNIEIYFMSKIPKF